MTDETADFVAGLRELADWYETHPDFALPDDSTFGVACALLVCPGTAAFNAAALELEPTDVEDNPNPDLVGVYRDFGSVRLRVLAFKPTEAADVADERLDQDSALADREDRRRDEAERAL